MGRTEVQETQQAAHTITGRQSVEQVEGIEAAAN